jgi:hypothetical protein
LELGTVCDLATISFCSLGDLQQLPSPSQLYHQSNQSFIY